MIHRQIIFFHLDNFLTAFYLYNYCCYNIYCKVQDQFFAVIHKFAHENLVISSNLALHRKSQIAIIIQPRTSLKCWEKKGFQGEHHLKVMPPEDRHEILEKKKQGVIYFNLQRPQRSRQGCPPKQTHLNPSVLGGSMRMEVQCDEKWS